MHYSTYIRFKKYSNTIRSPFQSYPTEEKDKQYDIRKRCSEVNSLKVEKTKTMNIKFHAAASQSYQGVISKM